MPSPSPEQKIEVSWLKSLISWVLPKFNDKVTNLHILPDGNLGKFIKLGFNRRMAQTLKANVAQL